MQRNHTTAFKHRTETRKKSWRYGDPTPAGEGPPIYPKSRGQPRPVPSGAQRSARTRTPGDSATNATGLAPTGTDSHGRPGLGPGGTNSRPQAPAHPQRDSTAVEGATPAEGWPGDGGDGPSQRNARPGGGLRAELFSSPRTVKTNGELQRSPIPGPGPRVHRFPSPRRPSGSPRGGGAGHPARGNQNQRPRETWVKARAQRHTERSSSHARCES